MNFYKRILAVSLLLSYTAVSMNAMNMNEKVDAATQTDGAQRNIEIVQNIITKILIDITKNPSTIDAFIENRKTSNFITRSFTYLNATTWIFSSNLLAPLSKAAKNDIDDETCVSFMAAYKLNKAYVTNTLAPIILSILTLSSHPQKNLCLIAFFNLSEKQREIIYSKMDSLRNATEMSKIKPNTD